MSKVKANITPSQKVFVLVQRLAGEKFDKVRETAAKLIGEGKSPERALADALEIHKCPNTFPDVLN